MKVHVYAFSLLLLVQTALANSGTAVLLDRYGEKLGTEVVLEPCDQTYLDAALDITEIDVSEYFCIFYQENYHLFFASLITTVYSTQSKNQPFQALENELKRAFIEGAELEVEYYSYLNRDGTDGEVIAFPSEQNTYLVIFQGK